MKMLVIVFVLAAVNVLSASAGTFTQIEGQMILQNGNGKPQINLVVNIPLTNALTLTGFGLYQRGQAEWSQGRLGVVWSPIRNVQLGGSAGVEQHDGLWRTGMTFKATPGNVVSFSVYEKGAGGSWYKTVTTVTALANTRLGLFGQKFAGWGPVVEHKLAYGKIWGTGLLRSSETPTVIIGLDVTN